VNARVLAGNTYTIWLQKVLCCSKRAFGNSTGPDTQPLATCIKWSENVAN
jgi:hypothetical protein